MFERLKIDLKAACFEATKRALNRLASVYERGDVYAFAIFAASDVKLWHLLTEQNPNCIVRSLN